jgi:S-formylglutathione hydrolase FrmB
MNLRRFAAVLALLLAVAASAFARVEKITVHALSLEKNLAGDSADQQVIVYLPPSYDSASTARYPVLYLLHGIVDTPEVWVQPFFDVPGTLDRLIAAKSIREFIVVMPNGKNGLLGSYYANSPVNGRWEDYIAVDLVNYIDGHYRTIAKAESRGIAGHSMGGFGTLNLAMHHPELYRAAYAMSPCCLDFVEDIGYGNPAWNRSLAFKTKADVDKAIADFDMYPVAQVGLARVFSPNIDAPLLADLPLRAARGELLPNDPAFTKWRESFPLAQVTRYGAALRQLAALTIDFGLDDQFAHIPATVPAFAHELSVLRVPHTLDVYAGDHRNRIKQRLATKVFPFFSEKLVFP